MASSLLRSGLAHAVRRCNPNPGVVRTALCKNRPVIFLSPRLVSSSAKKDATTASTGMLSSTEKTPYEIELEKLKSNNERSERFGFFADEPYLDKITFHGLFFALYSLFCVFGLSIAAFTPYFKGVNKQWRYREAHWVMQRRREKGEPLISPDFAPAEVIESMVPPPGEWEHEWLNAQPTTRPIMTGWHQQLYVN